MRRIAVIWCLLIIGYTVVAQNNYDASLIPKELMPYASAVLRNEEVTTEVKDLDNVSYHVKGAITVLNKNGDEMAHMVLYYNKSVSIKYVRGAAYNEFGKVISKFGESDFSDGKATSNSSLFDDERVKHYIPAITQYPYTIEYEYELKFKHTFYFRDWHPNPEAGLAVQKSSYTFICKPDFKIRYKELNVPNKVLTFTTKDAQKYYNWQISNVKATRDEVYSPIKPNSAIGVEIAPEKFQYFGIQGSFTNWEQLGKWMYDNLLAKRTDVPAETAQYIKELTAGISDPKLKAKKIYEFVQQKTHYISVQVGIGGFQPFLASDVDRDGYGDCKALVNYTKALLKVVGIDSYYCEVKSGTYESESLQPDFASRTQTDHVILCIPFKSDTTWLECTEQKIPFGYLGAFTDNRTVLACTPEGGKLIHTPKYTFDINLEKRTGSFTLGQSGELSGKMQTLFSGTDYADREDEIEKTGSERIKEVKRDYPINNMEIEKLEYKQEKSPMPVTTENVEFNATEYGAVNDGKFYFSLNSVDRYTHPLPRFRNRQNPVYINRGHTEEDEITYILPKGYHVLSEPLNLNLDKPFGSYKATMTVKGDQLIYSRKFQIKDGTYDKEMYQDLVDFYQSVVDADNYNVALAKN